MNRRPFDHRRRVLECWLLLEMFNAPPLPRRTGRTDRSPALQVVAWKPGTPLPWQTLAPPPPVKGRTRSWRHTVYLGVYSLADTYELLQRAFGDDPTAADDRPPGSTAMAALMTDADGRPLLDTLMLSAAAWGVGRLQHHAPLVGFDDAHRALGEDADILLGAARERAREPRPVPLDTSTLVGLLGLARRHAGIEGLGEGDDAFLVRSVAVFDDDGDAPDNDFLNSFFRADLSRVLTATSAGESSPALDEYLADDAVASRIGRHDITRDPAALLDTVRADRLPLGRWPADPAHSLALSQQSAVNRALTGDDAQHLLGVNGPPGTGKTTLLRDVLAGTVVQRAQRLAALSDPQQAFTGVVHEWRSHEYPRRVPQLRPDLTGFEMVVASANNAAVENVSNEIPIRKAIAEQWRADADYFAALATRAAGITDAPDTPGDPGQVDDPPNPTTGTAPDPASSTAPGGCWGLVAARLGNKANRSQFRSAVWFDSPAAGDDPGQPGLDSLLNTWVKGTQPVTPWPRARERFLAAQRRVEHLLGLRVQAERRLRQLPDIERRHHDDSVHLDRLDDALREVAGALDVQQRRTADAERHHQAAQAVHDRHVAARPGWVENLFGLGRPAREWRVGLMPLIADVDEAARVLAAEHDHERRLLDQRAHLLAQREQADHVLDQSTRQLDGLRRAIDADVRRFGAAHPRDCDDAERELRAPWLDAELDAARSELFLAAMQLHKDFLAVSAHTMREGLRAAFEVMSGQAPADIDPAARTAAWQLFFLVVPMVSTTFASAGTMFAGLGSQSLGWLFVDEAGQAAPQLAAGSIWRSQRVLAVGDPLQLQPVVTLPPRAVASIAAGFGVDATWLAPAASVQTLADRISPLGTHLPQASGQELWVSAPLRVHRRCDDPMFSVCNTIAYNGLMLNGVHRNDEEGTPFHRPELVHASAWFDEPAPQTGTHLQTNQVERARRAVDYLISHGVPAQQIIAVSPFRAVAQALAGLADDHPGLVAGTIHTAQGREADVVLLVLGSDPSRPGARQWAASSVNLVNVAVSRAKRRLYVIGDRDAWSTLPHFADLAAALDTVGPFSGPGGGHSPASADDVP